MYIFYSAVDDDGKYLRSVLVDKDTKVHLAPNKTKELKVIPFEPPTPGKFLRPCFNEKNKTWKESATPEELKAWREKNMELEESFESQETTQQQIEDLRIAQHETNMLLMQLLNGGVE